MSNRDYYEDTELDGLVPFVETGTRVSENDTIDAITEAIERADTTPAPLAEIGTPMRGDLYRLDGALREALDAAGTTPPEDAAGIVRWTLDVNDAHTIGTTHWLDEKEYADIDGRCISRLIDRLRTAAEPDEREAAAAALITEWERR